MKRLLLVSSSTVHPTGYLDHCEPWVRRHFEGAKDLLFVPYALYDRDAYAAAARERFAAMGLELHSIHEASDPVAAVEGAEGVFIGGGNTFRLLDTLYREKLLDPIRRRVREGMPYMGTSAGSNIAGATIRTTNDMPIVQPPSFDALGLVDFQLNPHYIDADPDSTHKGETREQRLNEFHEENDTPVVAIREGAMLVVQGDAVTLEGQTGGLLFRRGRPPLECAANTRIDTLLNEG